jgi:hypothetical protein
MNSMKSSGKDKRTGKRAVKDLAPSETRDVKAGADGLKLLATVAHHQAEDAKSSTTRAR